MGEGHRDVFGPVTSGSGRRLVPVRGGRRKDVPIGKDIFSILTFQVHFYTNIRNRVSKVLNDKPLLFSRTGVSVISTGAKDQNRARQKSRLLPLADNFCDGQKVLE